MLTNTIKRPLYRARFRAQMKWGYYRHHDRFDHPTIFIACCPKTGSTWLAQLLAEILPGYHCYYPQFQRDRKNEGFYDVTPAMVQDLQHKLATIHWHTPATPWNIEAMDQAFGFYLALVRDLRDVIISIYHFLHNAPDSAFLDDGIAQDMPWNAVSRDVLTLDKEACLDILIEQLLPGLTNLSLGWVHHARDHGNVLLLKYEDVTQNTSLEVDRILRFYGMEVPHSDISIAIQKLAPKPGQHKFRKGTAGNWANELAPAQQARCLEISGEFIEQMGYQR